MARIYLGRDAAEDKKRLRERKKDVFVITMVSIYFLGCCAAEEKKRLLEQAHLIAVSGVLLGGHFGTWVLCIETTSLPHALLVGSSAPIIIAVGAWIMRKPISRGTPIYIPNACTLQKSSTTRLKER